MRKKSNEVKSILGPVMCRQAPCLTAKLGGKKTQEQVLQSCWAAHYGYGMNAGMLCPVASPMVLASCSDPGPATNRLCDFKQVVQVLPTYLLMQAKEVNGFPVL